ncbi:molybdate ABC transporter substrate-binding protein [Nocardioides sp.]|uniref:molybdate ABC transporter substrate-binding protein n=1 Tax=Nocardioides sp. TaxID=35761 RepID=UPI002B270F03|nr:molybdate ABC transporter substrate-binding protein [Nocardioides sp.]
MRRLASALTCGVLLAGPVACGDDAGTASSGAEVTVLAAASLTGPFTALAAEFEAAHAGVSVRLAFDSSATLAAQAVQGAPADVLATADAATMQVAVDGGAVDGATTFATNTMTLVVPADNPAGLTSFADLDAPGVDYVACVETAPCGAVGAALLATNEIAATPASLETDVKAVLAKVASDEADAGLVYITDATAAGDSVARIDVPGADVEVLDYPIGVLEQAADADLAHEFVDLVLSAEGRAILERAGFGTP